MALRSRLSSAVATASIAVVAACVTAFVLRRRNHDTDTGSTSTTGTGAGSSAADAAIVEEKLHAYRDIMEEVVALNREAVALGPERFRHEADAIAFDQESALEEQYLDVNETYESYLYVIDESVREAASDYVGYLATYHDEGSHAGALLYRAGEIYEAMRADLGLESLFDEESAEPPDIGTDADIMPDSDSDPPDVDDFTETLGSAEDREYFNAGQQSPDENEGTVDDTIDDGDSGTADDRATDDSTEDDAVDADPSQP